MAYFPERFLQIPRSYSCEPAIENNDAPVHLLVGCCFDTESMSISKYLCKCTHKEVYTSRLCNNSRASVPIGWKAIRVLLPYLSDPLLTIYRFSLVQILMCVAVKIFPGGFDTKWSIVATLAYQQTRRGCYFQVNAECGHQSSANLGKLPATISISSNLKYFDSGIQCDQ